MIEQDSEPVTSSPITPYDTIHARWSCSSRHGIKLKEKGFRHGVLSPGCPAGPLHLIILQDAKRNLNLPVPAKKNTVAGNPEKDSERLRVGTNRGTNITET